jgi:hypothetical protein
MPAIAPAGRTVGRHCTPLISPSCRQHLTTVLNVFIYSNNSCIQEQNPDMMWVTICIITLGPYNRPLMSKSEFFKVRKQCVFAELL